MVCCRISFISARGRIRSFSTTRHVSLRNNEKEKSLYQCQVPIKLNSNVVNVNAIFQDTMPEGSSRGTLITIHGAPGSHKDFKYMVPFLTERNIRVIGLNLPGFGYSSYDDRLKNTATERDQFIDTVLESLTLPKEHRLVVAGHSRGSIDAIRLALRLKKMQKNIVGLVPINFVGFRPHRGIRPFFVVKCASWLWSYPTFRRALSPIYYLYYNKVLNFRATGEMAAICIQTMRNIDFNEQRNIINELKNSAVHILTLFSSKDFLTEVEISREVTDALDDNRELICGISDDEHLLFEMTKRELGRRRHVSVNFLDDGHYLQKHRAKFLSLCVDSLLRTHDSPKLFNTL